MNQRQRSRAAWARAERAPVPTRPLPPQLAAALAIARQIQSTIIRTFAEAKPHVERIIELYQQAQAKQPR